MHTHTHTYRHTHIHTHSAHLTAVEGDQSTQFGDEHLIGCFVVSIAAHQSVMATWKMNQTGQLPQLIHYTPLRERKSLVMMISSLWSKIIIIRGLTVVTIQARLSWIKLIQTTYISGLLVSYDTEIFTVAMKLKPLQPLKGSDVRHGNLFWLFTWVLFSYST